MVDRNLLLEARNDDKIHKRQEVLGLICITFLAHCVQKLNGRPKLEDILSDVHLQVLK